MIQLSFDDGYFFLYSMSFLTIYITRKAGYEKRLLFVCNIF